jgi:hypothetical protein
MADLVEIAQGRLSRDRPPEGSGGGTTPAGGEP